MWPCGLNKTFNKTGLCSLYCAAVKDINYIKNKILRRFVLFLETKSIYTISLSNHLPQVSLI